MLRKRITLLGEHWQVRARALEAVQTLWQMPVADALAFVNDVAPQGGRSTGPAELTEDVSVHEILEKAPWVAFSQTLHERYAAQSQVSGDAYGQLPLRQADETPIVEDGAGEFGARRYPEQAPVVSGIANAAQRKQPTTGYVLEADITRVPVGDVMSQVNGAKRESRTAVGGEPRGTHEARSLDVTRPQSAGRERDRHHAPDRDTKQSAELRHLDARLERSSHSVVNHQLKGFLGDLLKIRIPNVRIYANPTADRIARTFNADALTYDDKILFRTDKYQPWQPEGIALLGHELTHAAVPQSHSQSAASSYVDRVEERDAIRNESKLLRHFAPRPAAQPDARHLEATPLPSITSTPRQMVTTPVPVPMHGTTGANQILAPKLAESGRQLDLSASQEAESAQADAPPPPLSPMQLHQVYHYLKDKIREEGERWGIR